MSERHLRAVGADEVGGAADEPFSGAEAPELALLTPQQRSELRRAKRAALWVGLILPLVVVVAATAVLLAWSGRLPDPVARHWSGDEPDGFSSQTANLLTYLGLGGGMAVLFGLIGLLGAGQSTQAVWSVMNRIMAAASLTIVTSIMVMAVLTAHLQLDLSDARDAPGPGAAPGLSFGAGIALGVLAFFVQPRVRVDAPPGDEPPRLELGKTERAVWTGEVRPTRVFGWAMFGTIAAMAAGSLSVWLAEGVGIALWIMLGALLLVVVLLTTHLWFRVRADRDGIEARSLLGWPAFRAPIGDIARVEVREIAPFAEWGGWGTRWIPGRGVGIVMRTGEGLVVTRRDGRLFALTVDDAATAAALLTASVRRNGEEPGGDAPADDTHDTDDTTEERRS
jgi:hypothetical protein